MDPIWYPYLVADKDNSLLRDYPDALAGGDKRKLVVARDYHGERKMIKQFAVFDSVGSFYRYQRQLSQRNFYEVVHGPQKPHFDVEGVDVKSSKWEQTQQDLLRAVISVMEQLGHPLDLSRDVLLFTSSAKVKMSLHLVIDNYYHLDHLEAKSFYQMVISKMTDSSLVDGAVYSATQQFRILWSEKLGSGRPKYLVDKWSLDGRDIVYMGESTSSDPKLSQLEASLLTVVRGTHLPVPRARIYPSPSEHDFDGELTQEIVKLVIGRATDMYKGEFPFSVRQVKGSLIVLKRRRPSECKFCQRTHQSENPYLTVSREGDIFFYCRRAQAEGLKYCQCLGNIHDTEGPIPELSPIDLPEPLLALSSIDYRLAKLKPRKPSIGVARIDHSGYIAPERNSLVSPSRSQSSDPPSLSAPRVFIEPTKPYSSSVTGPSPIDSYPTGSYPQLNRLSSARDKFASCSSK